MEIKLYQVWIFRGVKIPHVGDKLTAVGKVLQYAFKDKKTVVPGDIYLQRIYYLPLFEEVQPEIAVKRAVDVCSFKLRGFRGFSQLDAGPNWAKVKANIADDSNFSYMVLSSSDNLIVSGNLKLYASGVIEFEQLVDSGDVVVEGDKIVTSNISDKYLPGILIGYINTINRDSNNLTKSGYITPAVDFEHLEEVLVILEQKQTVEEE